MALTTSFEVALKNTMLQQLKDASQLVLVAKDGAIFIASSSVTFTNPSNGRIQLTGNVTINIPTEDSPWNVSVIELRSGGISGTLLMSWVPSPAINFPDGGSLVITQLDVEIEN